MRLIDNKKDYYDYLAGILGIDGYITYDRRNSERLHNIGRHNTIMSEEYPYFSRAFCPYKNGIVPGRAYDKYLDYGTSDWDKPGKTGGFSDCYCCNSCTVGILIGFKFYVVRVYRVLENENDETVKLVPKLLCVKDYDRSTGDIKNITSPIIIGEVSVPGWMPWHHEDDMSVYANAKLLIHPRNDYYSTRRYWDILENPIMADTWIPSVIPAEDVWNNVTDYLLAIKEKPIIDNRTDIEHAESHGFDKKTSFRNM